MLRLDDETPGQLSAAAKRVGTARAWQIESWTFFGSLGAVWYSHTWKGNAIGHLDWQIGTLDANGDVVPARSDDGAAVPGVDTQLLEIAQQALDRLTGVSGSHSAWAQPLGTSLSCVAEGWLVGYHVNDSGDPVEGISVVGGLEMDNPDAVGEQWEAYSPIEVGKKDADDGKPRITVVRSEDGDPVTLPSDAIAVRIWRRHPRWPDDADGPMRPLLETCEDLLILQRTIRGSALSRTHAGLLLVPQEGLGQPTGTYALNLSNPDGQGPPPNPVVTEITAGLATPHRDPGSAAWLVPTVITTKGDRIAQWTHLALDREIDPLLPAQREELLRSYATGVDLPPERLLGMGDLNHWTAWQVGEDSWRHVDPDAKIVAAGMTTGYLWPSMVAAIEESLDGGQEVTPEQRDAIRQFRITYDPTAVIISPDHSDDADKAFDRGAIGWPAYRRYKHMPETDAPTPAELDIRQQYGLLKGPASASPLFGPPDEQASARTRSVTVVLGAASPNAGELLRFSTAVARMEATLLRDVLVMADGQIDEAVRKAQARLRSRASGEMRALVRGVPLDQVARVLGPREVSRLAAAYADSDDKTIEGLFSGALASLADRFRRLTASAQAAYRRMVDDLGLGSFSDEETDQMNSDTAAAAVVLSAGASAYAAARLFDQVAAAEQAGEIPSGVSIPIAVARRAVARAGGVPVEGGFTPMGRWEGGALTGPTERDQLAARGLTATGLVWVYGDPGTRHQPYEPHLDLDGVEAPDAAGFFGFEPGDHDGCQCSWASTWEALPDEGEG